MATASPATPDLVAEGRSVVPRWLYAALAITSIVAVLGAGTVAWMAADPQHWFPGAYAEKGPRGDTGPRGTAGPRGPVGPPGVSGDEDVSSRLDALETSVLDLQSLADDSSAVDDLQTRLEEVAGTVDDLSSTLGDTEATAAEAWDRVEEACSQLAFDLDTFGC
jgi:hypothetical protein